MQYIYATLLLHKAGKKIDEESIGKILTAAGVDVDKSRAKAIVTAVSDLDIEEALKVSAVAAAAPVATKEAPKAESEAGKKKEEKKDDEPEEVQGLGALFG